MKRDINLLMCLSAFNVATSMYDSWRRKGGSNSRAGLLRPTSLANSPLHLLGYSSILNYQAFHLNRGFGRTYVRRLNVLQGLYVSLSIIKKWLSIPTLRIWYHPLLPHCLNHTGLSWSLSYQFNKHDMSCAWNRSPRAIWLTYMKFVCNIWVVCAVAELLRRFSHTLFVYKMMRKIVNEMFSIIFPKYMKYHLRLHHQIIQWRQVLYVHCHDKNLQKLWEFTHGYLAVAALVFLSLRNYITI